MGHLAEDFGGLIFNVRIWAIMRLSNYHSISFHFIVTFIVTCKATLQTRISTRNTLGFKRYFFKTARKFEFALPGNESRDVASWDN